VVCVVSTANARAPERNVAKDKPATQLPTSTYDPSVAVDGNFSISAFTITCSLAEEHSWWAVDLLERFLVKSVIISTDDDDVGGYLDLFITVQPY